MASKLTSISQQMVQGHNKLGMTLSDEDLDDEENPLNRIALHLAKDGNKAGAQEPEFNEGRAEPANRPTTKPGPKLQVPQPSATQPEGERVTYKPTSSDDSSEDLEADGDEESDGQTPAEGE